MLAKNGCIFAIVFAQICVRVCKASNVQTAFFDCQIANTHFGNHLAIFDKVFLLKNRHFFHVLAICVKQNQAAYKKGGILFFENTKKNRRLTAILGKIFDVKNERIGLRIS